MDSGQKFIDWLDEQETVLGFSDYEVALRGGFSHSALSKARKDKIPPGFEICIKISRVFNVSEITVLRASFRRPK